MSSGRRNPSVTFRPDRDEIEPVRRRLTSEGREMDGMLRACLRWFANDPDAALRILSEHWPPPRPRGRPPRHATAYPGGERSAGQ